MKKINYNKAQVSAEFILIFTVVLSSFLLFLNIINSRLGEVQEQKEYILMQTLASNIKEEIILATQVHNNYIRRFSIPLNINTKDYNMYIEKNELKIDLYDAGNYEGEPSKTVYAVLPIDVKGGFVEEKDENTLDHCVTKNQFDGIRISRNQVSLDIDTRNFEVNEFGIPRIPKDSYFDVYVSINCVKNIRALQFTLKYDPTNLEIDSVIPITGINHLDAFFRREKFILEFSPGAKSDINNGLKYIDPVVGRYTYAIISDQCEFGTGNIAKIRFLSKQKANTTILFDPDFNTLPDTNIVVLDCFTNERTTKGLPNTKIDAKIEII